MSAMPTGTSCKFTGGTNQVVSGAVYLPKAAINFSGGASNANGCTQVIGDTISFVGTSNLAANCSGVGTTPIGTATASLVE